MIAIKAVQRTNTLLSHFRMASSVLNYDYDLVVIGGGSGGLSAAKEATKQNPQAKVLCLDFVQPSPHGTRWGLGGTCVNVGCVPKKLYHYASLLGRQFEHAHEFGWSVEAAVQTHDWGRMRTLVTDYIKSLNFMYKSGLRSANVKYEEAYAKFVDPHTIQWKGKFKSGSLTSAKFLIATGGRPQIVELPGKELCVTSDDIFWLPQNPGKTLVIGAGYIALECAGFLKHLGNDVTVMVRGEFMRKFDKQSAAQIGELMERDGIRFLLPASPLSFAKVDPAAPVSAIDVTYMFNNDPTRAHQHEIYDTVLLAVGRVACVSDLNLAVAGVALSRGKVLVDEADQTTAAHIYAIGDVATGIKTHLPHVAPDQVDALDRPELTPVAIAAGRLLAQRLFGKSLELMNYSAIPTTVFTPAEYGFVGLTEEQAESDEKEGGIGRENVEIFYSRFGTLETSPTHPNTHTELRSKIFTGPNVWMRRYTREHGLEWPESGLTESSVVNIVSRQLSGTISAKVQNALDGRFVCDVLLADGTTAAAVPEADIELIGDSRSDNAELFVKANCLAKLICDKRHAQRVVGLHFIGPNAGEVLQGFSLAIKMGATKHDFDRLCGIHPTAAEEFTVLTVTKASGSSCMKKAGCGGGSCG